MGATNVNRTILSTVVCGSLLVVGCGQGAGDAQIDRPSIGSAEPTSTSTYLQSATGQTKRLVDEKFNSLGVFEQYRVANKLYSTLYKSLGVSEFFKLESGLIAPETINGGNYIGGLLGKLLTDLPQSELHRLDLAILGSDVVETENQKISCSKADK